MTEIDLASSDAGLNHLNLRWYLTLNGVLHLLQRVVVVISFHIPIHVVFL